jgi:hypothetical protein
MELRIVQRCGQCCVAFSKGLKCWSLVHLQQIELGQKDRETYKPSFFHSIVAGSQTSRQYLNQHLADLASLFSPHCAFSSSYICPSNDCHAGIKKSPSSHTFVQGIGLYLGFMPWNSMQAMENWRIIALFFDGGGISQKSIRPPVLNFVLDLRRCN